ncbi:MAG TPA: HupE/UreJ family protein [Polyangiaceae bacterium]|nr:HupE/UreJ family protein [Polyangiaceae bacterium]
MVRRAAFFFLAAALVMILPGLARAHEVGLSRGEYTVVGAVVSAEITFSRRELAGAVPELDPDRDGVLSGSEVEKAKGALHRAIVDRVKVSAEDAPCPGDLEAVTLVEEDGIALRGSFRCPKVTPRARVELAIFEELPHGHRHIARSAAGENVLFKGNPSIELASSGSPPPETPKPSALGFLELGVEHILTGFDHLVFLLGLVLVGGRVRSLLLVVTAFTVAHSITLGAAVLGLWAPSPSIVEPLIALSIIYVGVENFFVKDAEKRWRITLPFGLIHGFGFAGALGEIALPRAEIPVALLAFNVGVELGQVAVLALVLPVILAAKKRAWFERTGVKAISAAIAAAGLFWFVTRVFEIELF